MAVRLFTTLLLVSFTVFGLGCSSEKPEYPRVWRLTAETDGITAVREIERLKYEIEISGKWFPADRADSGTNYLTKARQVNFLRKSPNGLWDGPWTFTLDEQGFLRYRSTATSGPRFM